MPSNFVERLEGETLIEFYQSVFLGIGDGDDSVCTSIAQDLDFISSDEGYEDSKKYFSSRKATLSHYASCTDLDMTEDEADAGDDSVDFVSPPKHLTLETQLNKSFVIGWSPPECPATYIDHYQVRQQPNHQIRDELKPNYAVSHIILKLFSRNYLLHL